MNRNISADASTSDVYPPASPSRGHPYSASYVWYVIVLLTLVNLVNYMDRMALAVLAPMVKVDLALSDAQLGLLIGFAFALFYAICGIPLGRWADRGIRRNIIALALTTWSAMTALCGAAQSFWHLFAARVGVGAGEAGSFAPGSSILCDYVPLKRRSGVFAVHSFGIYAGTMTGLVLAGWLGEVIGWRWAFVMLGVPGIVLALVVRFTLREPPRGFFDKVEKDQPALSLGHTIGVLWQCRTYRWLAFFLTVNGFVQYGMTQWWPSFYSRSHGLTLGSLGIYLGMAIGIGSGIGLLVGGFLANKTAQRDVRLPLRICGALASLTVPAAFGTLFVPSMAVSILLVSVTAVFWNISIGPAIATLYSVTEPRMRATAGALYIFATSVLGFGMGPFCVGLLSDLLAPSLGVQALRYAMLLPPCLLPLMVIALYAAAKALPKDLQAVGAPAEPSYSVTTPIQVAATK